MGTTYYTLAVFDKPWREVLENLSREFRYTRELAYQREDREKDLRFLFDMRGFKLVEVGNIDYPMKTIPEWGGLIALANVETYSRENTTLVQIEAWTSGWMFVLSSEVMKFLRKLMRAGAVLICGYTDDHDFRDAGFKEDNQFLFYEWLVGEVEKGKLEAVPSGFTLVKGELLNLDDGLYELEPRPGESEKEYVLIKSLGEDKVLVTIKRDNLRDDECYRDLLEDRAWFSLSLTDLRIKRIGKRVEDEFLMKRAEKYFKTQIGINHMSL